VTKDRRLGRGLAALLGSPTEEELVVDSAPTSGEASPLQPATSPRPTTPRPMANTPSTSKSPMDRQSVTGAVPLINTSSSSINTLELSVYEIDNNPFQPRRKFNQEEIASLAASIREHEQLQPILVRRDGQRFQLISGERRLRAAIHAGLKTIRAEVREADDRLVAELAIVENLQRKDLDAIEKAMSFRRYIDQHKCTQEDLAKRLKIDRSTIANLMRLLELPEEIHQCIQNDTVSAGHARALLPLGDEQQQLEFAKLIREEGWNVRETERRVAERLAAEDNNAPITSVGYTKPSRKKTSPQIAALEQQMRLALGTKTEIRQNATGRGKISISFANNEEFERLCQLICPQIEKQRAA
jgi:ParB family transcriptional regulator, chromosome partitioning protein